MLLLRSEKTYTVSRVIELDETLSDLNAVSENSEEEDGTNFCE